ncbi:protease inhibitor I42 family protein [Candidatus Nitrospira bockiana]
MLEAEREVKRISASLAGTIQLKLWEDRTRGELWVPSYDATALALVDENFLRTTSNNAVDAGTRTFEFRPLRAGSHRVLFEKRMGWKFTAEDRRVFVIDVFDVSTNAERDGHG